MKKCKINILFSCFIFSANLCAQSPTEFPKGFVMHAKLHNGMLTRFSSLPDQYTGGFQFVPQITVVPGYWRVGLIAGGLYTHKQLEAQFGATMSLKLKEVEASVFGSAGNVHLSFDYILGTGKQQLLGGGINIDALNKLVLGITTHRDVSLNSWWFQTTLGVRLSKLKKIKEPFNQ